MWIIKVYEVNGEVEKDEDSYDGKRVKYRGKSGFYLEKRENKEDYNEINNTF